MQYYFYYHNQGESPYIVLAEELASDGIGVKVVYLQYYAKIKTFHLDNHNLTSHIDTHGFRFKTFKELKKYTYITSGLVIKEEVTYE